MECTKRKCIPMNTNAKLQRQMNNSVTKSNKSNENRKRQNKSGKYTK